MQVSLYFFVLLLLPMFETWIFLKKVEVKVSVHFSFSFSLFTLGYSIYIVCRNIGIT